MIIGIDLGTTNSLAAYYTEHGPEIIPNRLGERLTPSVVSIDENDQVYVGKTALERMAVYPDQTANLFKRSMGSRKEFKLGNKNFYSNRPFSNGASFFKRRCGSVSWRGSNGGSYQCSGIF